MKLISYTVFKQLLNIQLKFQESAQNQTLRGFASTNR
jgi:hypothetical protein